jgi:non-canonical poly(A) RNA polymerase PAPD5/7
MLCLRDPADETNDLGRKALSIKHVQATFRKLSYDLDRDIKINTRASLLDKLVGPAYLLNKERRAKLRQHGNNLSEQMKTSLAAKAKRIREREGKEEVNKQRPEDKGPARFVQTTARSVCSLEEP